MDKKMLQKTFREYKKAAGVAYAITNPDGLGDCQSCVNCALEDKYGLDSLGIWVKHWTRGMNACNPIDDDRIKMVYVAHDLDYESAEIFYEVFGENYNVLPKEYDPSYCFQLYEKGTDVYTVSYTNEYDHRCTESFVDKDASLRYAGGLLNASWARDITIEKTF